MRHILFVILILILAACDNRQSYILRQQGEYQFDITRIKDTIFIKTTNNDGCIVDTFYKGKDGFYATWCNKLFFATVDTFVSDTVWPGPHMYLNQRIRKVKDSQRDPKLRKYKDVLYKTELISYNQDWYVPLVKDMPPELIMVYYYDCNYNIVRIVYPCALDFSK